jgi:hypothetical protein
MAGAFRGFWEQRLDALGTELARGKRERRRNSAVSGTANTRNTRSTGKEEQR